MKLSTNGLMFTEKHIEKINGMGIKNVANGLHKSNEISRNKFNNKIIFNGVIYKHRNGINNKIMKTVIVSQKDQ